MQYEDNTIIVVPSSIKEKILLEINDLKRIINIKIYTINEYVHKFYFDYDERAIFYIQKKYKVKPEIAKIYLENMYYLGKEVDDEKVNFLTKLHAELSKEKLITNNSLFLESLKGKKVIFLNIPETQFNKRLFEETKLLTEIEILNEEDSNNSHGVYHFKTLEEEVIFSANKICELIKSGMSVNNIYLVNISEEHRYVISRIFAIFNIPYKLVETNTLIGTKIVSKFLDVYKSDIKETLSEVKKDIKNKDDEDIYNKIIKIVNKFYFIKDFNEIKENIINEFKNTKIHSKQKANCVKEVSFLEYPFKEDDYVFLFNFNQGIIPKIYKDEQYLNDKLMAKLELDTAPYLNKIEKNRTVNKIKNTKNLFISYIDTSLSTSFYPSQLIEELNMNVIDYKNDDYCNSNIFNKIELASYLNKYQKYNIVEKDLPLLCNNYKLEKYNNEFTSINTTNLYKYLNEHLTLSYSSLNNYFKCGFRYYINNILKLDIFEETFIITIGNIFHEVLEKYFRDHKDFDSLYQEAINNSNYEYTIKDKFFLEKLKNELLFIIKTIEDQNKYSNLNDELYEENIEINIEGNIAVKFVGKIDKLKYTKKDNRTIIAVIDYKTGNPELDINNVIYGLEMQLPVYIYLAKNSPKIENIEVAGFYLQKILNSEVQADGNHSYEELKKDKLKLQGYSNSDYSIIGEFDSSFSDSNVIKGLKVSKNGFYNHSKVLDSKQIEDLTNIVENNIKNATTSILNGDFSINPKALDDKNIGCEFCKFKNLCYFKEKDLIKLKRYKNMEFLGGDSDDQMD